MAESPLVKKLLIKAGFKVAIVNPPARYLEEFGQLPVGARVVGKVDSFVEFVQIFIKDSAEFDKFVPSTIAALKTDNIFWLCYPKGTAKVETDLNRDILWEKMKKLGYTGVAMISINKIWSAMRFRPSGKAGK